jgi:hypothetical protein
MELEKEKPYLKTPPDSWSMRIVFDLPANDTNDGTNTSDGTSIQSVYCNIVKSVEAEKYTNFRMNAVYLALIGFVYPCKLRPVEAEKPVLPFGTPLQSLLNTTPVVDFTALNQQESNSTISTTRYEYDSLDLAYWHKVIFAKLALGYKPSNPTIKLSSSVQVGNAITPVRIEFYYGNGTISNEILEIIKIEKNN